MHAQLMSPNTTYIGPYFTFAFTTVRTFIPDVRALFKRRLRSTGYLYWRCVSCNVSSDTSIRYSRAEGVGVWPQLARAKASSSWNELTRNPRPPSRSGAARPAVAPVPLTPPTPRPSPSPIPFLFAFASRSGGGGACGMIKLRSSARRSPMESSRRLTSPMLVSSVAHSCCTYS